MSKKGLFWKTLSLAKALLTGKDVDADRLKKRLEICKECPLSVQWGNVLKCSICGCKLGETGLINLARYEETEEFGCKFDTGSKWKAAGV